MFFFVGQNPFFERLERRAPKRDVSFGLLANWFQASTILIITVLVGGVLQIVKLAILDAAGREFNQHSYLSRVAFLLPFGLSKAIANLLVGYGADKVGRKPMECIGWGIGLLVPLFLWYSSARASYATAVAAYVFLGVHQGFSWSAAIFMTVDLMGPEQRGLAVGLNETVGYTSIALFSRVYAVLERHVTCSWGNGASATDLDAVSQQCLSDSTGLCRNGDDWRPSCSGWCNCVGYMTVAAEASAIIMGAGLLMSSLLLKETKDTHLRAEMSVLHEDGKTHNDSSASMVIETDAPAGDNVQVQLLEVELAPASRTAQQAARLSAEHPRPTELLQGSLTSRGCQNEMLLPSLQQQSHSGTLTCCALLESRSVICIAGFVVNCTAGLAWGLLLAWARDGLEMNGMLRNMGTASYDTFKGLSQFLSGIVSDKAGRKWIIVTGLLMIAAGLLTAAMGMGFDGKFLAARNADDVPQLQFGTFIISAVLLGIGSGVAYPVMIAAIADHSEAASRAKSLGLYRFWRDTGYAGGFLLSGLSDASRPEVSLFTTSVLVIAAGMLVSTKYVEKRACLR